MISLTGIAIDLTENVAHALQDPESVPAGFGNPHYALSDKVSVSRSENLYVYHLPDDQLGHGASLGNASAWTETKGNGQMLGLYSIALGQRVVGGMGVSYLLPFSDLSVHGHRPGRGEALERPTFTRAMPSAPGRIHLHPAYQQREFVLGDGLHVLETFFMPRTGDDDPASACMVVSLKNVTPHPLGITVVANLDLRGHGSRDLTARYERSRRALLAHSASEPDHVRLLGSGQAPDGYWATTRHEQLYNPEQPLPNRTDEQGELVGALQHDLIILPRQRRKVRFIIAFSHEGRKKARHAFDRVRGDKRLLKKTIDRYNDALHTGLLEMPDALLNQGVQWAKACLLRPVAQYAVGQAFTNDPGHSSHLVGRDLAWFVHGSDWVDASISCSLLDILARTQREDGLIAEYVDGRTGKSVDHGFNINDNTPLFVMAVGHHVETTGHDACLDELYEPARKACELILSQRSRDGLIVCTQRGVGAQAICGWRNVLAYEQISGIVTELNAECHAALRAMAALACRTGREEEAERYQQEADRLRQAINEHLIDPHTGLYLRNIDLDGHVFNEATIDMVFPLICGVAEIDTATAVLARLSGSDFMTPGGVRVLSEQNARWDPSANSGCLGGVWPGASWWFAMGCTHASPEQTAESLRRSYEHYVIDPTTYNTVPGQFSEWSDGQTLVNRGMRLSPWEPPRFLWAAIEGIAGIGSDGDHPTVQPQMPVSWQWLRLCNLPYRGRRLAYFLARQPDGLHLYTPSDLRTTHHLHRYDQEIAHGVEAITVGLSATAFARGPEILVCLGNSFERPMIGPFLAHHTLDPGQTYHVERLTNIESEWHDLGEVDGGRRQRFAVQIPPRGYALYRFTATG